MQVSFSPFSLVIAFIFSLLPYTHQAYATVPLQVWLPKAGSGAPEGKTVKLTSATEKELDALIFPTQVKLNTLCELQNPIVYVQQDIYYTDFNSANKPASVGWIKKSEANAAYALDIGYIFNEVSPILNSKLKTSCPTKQVKTILMSSSASMSELEALSNANPQSLFVFSGVLLPKSFLSEHQFFTPAIFTGLAVTVFFFFLTFVSSTLVANVKVSSSMDRPRPKLKQQ